MRTVQEWRERDLANRRELRAAMRWWRAAHPRRVVRVVSHNFVGHVLWSNEGDAGPVGSVARVLEGFRARLDGDPRCTVRDCYYCRVDAFREDQARALGAPRK